MAILNGPRVRHSVVFTPRHEEGTPELEAFLAALTALGGIDGVEALEVVREVSPKNSYRFGVAMEFADSDAYDSYNSHPDHVAFVRDHWAAEVVDFLEVDFAALRTS